MDLGLAGKVVAIVGGTTGIGFAAAEVLAEEGATLALIGRNGERATSCARELAQRHGIRAAAFPADARGDAGAIDAAFAAIGDRFGTLHGLAVTAGPMQKMAVFEDLSDEDWHDYFDSQLMTTVRACRAAVLLYGPAGGNVVLTAAHSIRSTKAPLAGYAAAKSAIASLSKHLAQNWANRGIRCNCICPGAIATEALDGLKVAAMAKYGTEARDPLAALDRYLREEWHLATAMGRVGRPREVGELIAFLLSQCAGYLNGALINIDGGTDF